MSSVNEEFVTALYDYHAKDPDELTIRKNESLTLLDGSGPWYKVGVHLVCLLVNGTIRKPEADILI